ncbi:unnamed protein product [Blepharisma stoltei]|uniref:DNA replication licensing factor MCM3 n=1 Tax=Blepharisma stoltei TaxID=1481888 RepID=A0AAU9IMN0_9CILI|nr:unnamed protein product [Blepharisma stoltei]
MEVENPTKDWTRLGVVANDLFQEDLYQERIRDMIANDSTRLAVSLDDIRQKDPNLPDMIFNEPIGAIRELETALKNAVMNEVEAGKKVTQSYRITFEGNFGVFYITPRGLKSTYTNKLVRVQGIVTRMSLVRPKLMSSSHYCDATKKFVDREYSDQYDLETLRDSSRSNAIPTHDPDGHPYSFEYGLSKYKNHQTLTIQELPERSPVGQLPRSIEVILEDDLVDKVKPGDRVDVVGVYKTISTASSGSVGIFKTIIIASNVVTRGLELSMPNMTGTDIRNIKELSKKTNLLEILGTSFAPSIFGHDQIKKALVLLLLGGIEKNLENGTHLRGDINIMFIGDPSTAKSQLLRSIMNIAPLATSTTGRGASGVGLTAAVSKDRETGERILEAGAMVLADRGVICIDEFDKMNEVDRVAIHEVMEQQTVTIAKAGIHTSLNARCSVVAAANPIYGSYMRDKSPAWNIALPDSLLSRFDLLFVVLDQKMPEIDRLIASRVIQNHCYSGNGNIDDMDLDNPVIEPLPEEGVHDEEDTPVYINYEGKDVLHRNFLKKFIYYAKKTVEPKLTNESSNYIAQSWATLRSKEEEGGRHRIVPITVRTLETLIRLSTAIAKAHLSQTVKLAHCEEAFNLLKFAIFQEEEKRVIPQAEEDVEMADVLTSLGSKSKKRQRKREDESGKVSSLVSKSKAGSSRVALEESQILVFRCLTENVRNLDLPSMKVSDLWNLVKEIPNSKIASKRELVEVVKELNSAEKVMYNEEDESVILIL